MTPRSLGYSFHLVDGRISCRITDNILANGVIVVAGPDLRDGRFHHVAMTLVRNSGTGGHLYVDGTSVLTFDPTSQSGDLSTPQPVLIGMHPHYPAIDCNFRGVIEEVSIYNRALTAVEVKSINDAGALGKCGLAVPPSVCLNGAQVKVDGQLTSAFSGTANWQTNTVTVSSTTNGTALEIGTVFANSGVLLDSFTFADLGGPYYVLPEESLDKINGVEALGNWQLELWDTRARATNPPPSVVKWQLALVLENTTTQPTLLTHNLSASNSVSPGHIRYFTVDVPSWAHFCTNWLITASGPVNLLFNQTTLPTGTNAGDVTLLANSTGGIRTLASGGTPPLVPGATYFLGVQNPGALPVTFALEIDFDVTPLTNAISVSSSLASNSVARYFSYDVTSNETAVLFQLTNLTGNASLVLRDGLPFPNPGSFDYASFNPGTNDEFILVLTNSDPVPLRPGRWYIGVFNADITNLNYTHRRDRFHQSLSRSIHAEQQDSFHSQQPRCREFG